MKFNPCKKDIQSDISEYLFLLIADVIAYFWIFGRDFFLSKILVIGYACFITTVNVKRLIYFSRSISLDEEGWSICIGKHTKKFLWSETIVYDYKNDKGSMLKEWGLPGILLSTHPVSSHPRSHACNYCASHHPVSSVFFRYQTEHTTPKDAKRMNKTVEGYTVSKEEILNFLDNHNIPIRKA